MTLRTYAAFLALTLLSTSETTFGTHPVAAQHLQEVLELLETNTNSKMTKYLLRLKKYQLRLDAKLSIDNIDNTLEVLKKIQPLVQVDKLNPLKAACDSLTTMRMSLYQEARVRDFVRFYARSCKIILANENKIRDILWQECTVVKKNLDFEAMRANKDRRDLFESLIAAIRAFESELDQLAFLQHTAGYINVKLYEWCTQAHSAALNLFYQFQMNNTHWTPPAEINIIV